MQRRPFLHRAAALALMPLAGRATAQSLPKRPIRIVVPFGPGGVADVTTRIVASALAAQLGQSVIVENRPGAGGVVAGEQVARAKPDGTTLLLMSNATAISARLLKQMPFDAQKDFAPISVLGVFDLVLVAPAQSRLRTLADLLAQARAQPGKLDIGTIAIGSTQNLAAQLLKSDAGIDLQIVPYNGTAAVLTALQGGEVDAAVEVLSPVLGQIRAGALRALAVLGTKRSPLLPQVPAVRETGGGLAQFSAASWNALAAPAGTPAPVLARLNDAVRAALASPEVRRKLTALGVEPQPGTPAQLAALLASEIARWGAVIERAGIPRQ
ncbi:MAG: tripartite tricarboxylate transporter substrate binding protein [Proteobacteria bacterium]|nr:tripartite tricarboxylate transporter substrate binding protein [Pseudomonadota bacterium]